MIRIGEHPGSKWIALAGSKVGAHAAVLVPPLRDDPYRWNASCFTVVREHRILDVERVSRRFGPRLVMREVSLSIGPSEIMCLLGPSGSQKSTLLKIIAGILEPTSGWILIRGAEQRAAPTYRRDIGFVFQSPAALFPHLNVSDNVAFPFRRGKRKALEHEQWRDTVVRMLRITGLQPHAESSIATLSGGELRCPAVVECLDEAEHHRRIVSAITRAPRDTGHSSDKAELMVGGVAPSDGPS